MRLLLVLMLVCGTAHAEQFHKCVQPNGVTVYSRQPCATGASEVGQVDTARALRAGERAAAAAPAEPLPSDAAALAARMGTEAACARERAGVEQRHAAELARIDKLLADAERNAPGLAEQLGRDRAQAERALKRELELARRRCTDPAQAAPVPTTRSPQPPGPSSWKCIAENGEVFFRHDACPSDIRVRHAEGRAAAVLLSLSVEADRIARAQACAEIASPDAWSRRGRERDQFPPEDGSDDPCRK